MQRYLMSSVIKNKYITGKILQLLFTHSLPSLIQIKVKDLLTGLRLADR
jgi:hypothetical protein